MKLKSLSLLIIAILFSVSSTSAQNAAADEAGKAVKLQISFSGGKNVYRIGEQVKLILSYTSAEPGYVVESYYSPRFDDVILSPTDGIYPWLYRLNRHYSYDDVSAPQKLFQSPIDINITINNLVRFDKPGKYKVKVISRRVWKSSAELSFRSNAVPILSNEIEFEMKEMSQEEEAREVKRITTLIDSANNLNQQQIYKQDLDFLSGDISTIEKVSRFLNPPIFNKITWLDSGTGLMIARNKKLAVELLEKALRDPNREIYDHLIRTLVTLRLLVEDEKNPNQAKSWEQISKEREQRSSELSRAYYAELLESLSKRTGKSQLITAYSIFTSRPKDDTTSPEYATSKALILEKFDELSHSGQSELLDRYWDKIKTPALIPSLEKILSGKEPEPVWSNRANAFKRLIELDQKRARPFVINEIRDPSSIINPDILKALDDEFLPEIDDALLEQITRLASTEDRQMQLNLQFKMLLAARYATSKIYKELLDIYNKYGVNQSIEQSGPLLSYLVRHNEKEGISLIKERLVKSGEKSGSNIFYNLTRINHPPGLERIFRKRLESEDAEVARSAAYHLTKYPTEENRKLIETRHERWLREWAGRAAELDDPKTDPNVKIQAMLQTELLSYLMEIKEWKLPDTEIYHLKLKCVTQSCREYFSRRYVSP